MAFHQPDAVRYLAFELLETQELVHAIFTRQGGVSPEPWSALNVGGTVGDEPERVMENRRRAFQALGQPLDSMYDVWQTHSADVVIANAPRLPGVPHLKADAILTDRPGVTLFMRFADCVPILLYDPQHKVIGLAHAGWQGTIKKVVAATLQVMQMRYSTQAEEVLAAIGPSVGPHHYEIGPEVAKQVREVFGDDASGLLPQSTNGTSDAPLKVQFDLWQANRLILEQAGVIHIENAEICTACHLEDWYSHRGERGKTGRFGALIALRE